MASISRPLSGRRAERAILERAVEDRGSEFIAIYGRRRVGKTFLVRKVFQNRPEVFFEVVGRHRASMADNLLRFAEAMAETFHGGVALAPPNDWHEAFRALQQAVERHRGRRKFVLFFDELPWLATHRSGFLSELESFWNGWCSKRDDIVLIACGSAASWMLRKVVDARGGLHNRLTRTIRLLPFTVSECADFFEHRGLRFTHRDVVELYMTFGGVPHYLDRIERGLSVAQIIDAVCLSKDGALRDEFDRLFASLFDDDDTYVDVVKALSQKRRGLRRSEVLAASGLASGGGASTILRNLEEGGFITETVPYGRTARDRLYRLTDEFVLFHLAWLQGRRPKTWQLVRKSPRWRAWSGLAFESVCLKHVEAIERALGISGVRTEASAWLHDDAQIDLLIDRADDVVSICEIKFTDEPFSVTKKYAEELQNKVATFRRETGTTKSTHLVFVTSRGVAENRYSRELVDAVVELDALFF